MAAKILRNKRPLRFTRALHRAVWRAWKDGKIKGSEAYLLYDVIQGSKRGGRYYLKPELLQQAEEACRNEMVIYDAESAKTGDIDWAHWIDLLVEWMPLIIRVILTLIAFAEPPANEPPESSKITGAGANFNSKDTDNV